MLLWDISESLAKESFAKIRARKSKTTAPQTGARGELCHTPPPYAMRHKGAKWNLKEQILVRGLP